MSKKMQNILRFSVLILSVAAIVYGLASGENQIVFKKAADVCMECIGIG